jgi:hypothetical protein
MAGHNVKIKTSSNICIYCLFWQNISLSNTWVSSKITFVEGKLENFDAVIATGSNNTALF